MSLKGKLLRCCSHGPMATDHWGTVRTKFWRPERLALLIVGVLCPTPINTVLFVAAGLCCVFSYAQILARGITVQNERREKEFQRDV